MARRGAVGVGPRRGQAAARSRRRGVALLAMLVAIGFTLSACGDTNPYSHISPRTETADDIQFLYKIVFWAAVIVFVLVQFFIAYTALRFRKSNIADTADRPEQIHGNKTLELTWTIVPAIVLLVILIPTITTLYEFDAEADEVDEGGMIVDVYAKHWWWEIHYPDALGNPTNVQNPEGEEPPGIVTANEVRVPVGKEVVFRLHSNNVIHSFWVPQLTGKMDVIPGHNNRLAMTPREPGTYYGECTEFCGEQHAWMRFTVVAEPQESFDAWVAAWNAPPDQAAAAAANTGDVAIAPSSFGLCIGCHRVNGVDQLLRPNGEPGPIPPHVAGIGGLYNQGPNLTLFGCRDYFAGGVMKNTPENLRQWLYDPASVKSGNLMSTVIQRGTLPPEQIEELTNWLGSLKLPGGTCPADAGQDPGDARIQDAPTTETETP